MGEERSPEKDAHVCDTPPTALPGDEWTCPVCGQRFWAEDDEAEGAAAFHWERVIPPG